MFGFSIIGRFKAVFLFWFLSDTCCYVRVHMVSSNMFTCITAANYSFWVICLVIMSSPPKVRRGDILVSVPIPLASALALPWQILVPTISLIPNDGVPPNVSQNEIFLSPVDGYPLDVHEYILVTGL